LDVELLLILGISLKAGISFSVKYAECYKKNKEDCRISTIWYEFACVSRLPACIPVAR